MIQVNRVEVTHLSFFKIFIPSAIKRQVYLDTRIFMQGFHLSVMQSAIEARVAGSIIQQKS